MDYTTLFILAACSTLIVNGAKIANWLFRHVLKVIRWVNDMPTE